jgi:hypothetical protein
MEGRRKQRIKISEKIYKNYMENSRRSILLKKEKTLTYQQHGRFTQNFEKFKGQVKQKH